MPSSYQARQAIIRLIPSDVEGKILELGSGWGHLAFFLADYYPRSLVEAYEISPIPWAYSKCLAYFKKKSNVLFFRKNFFEVSFLDASVVVCYLYPGAMVKLKEKFETELKPGTWIITNTFAVPGWKPLHILRLKDIYQTPIYLYKIDR